MTLPLWLDGRKLPSYPSIEAFYADRGGARSGESDFGCWWYDGEQAYSGCWRISAVGETGDVYAIRQRARALEEIGAVVLLGNLGGPDLGYTKAHAVLDGWEQICGAALSLQWAAEKVALVSGTIAAVSPPEPSQAEKDAAALDELAQILCRVTWPPAAEFVSWAADIVRSTGRSIV